MKSQVDNNFFQDYKKIHPLNRIINVLGTQLLDEAVNSSKVLKTLSSILNANQSRCVSLHQNSPAYTALKKQQDVVEKMINHLSVHHCFNLNASEVTVGMVNKKIYDAMGQVKGLRR